ncbi:hypothetical protein AYL99_03109 [Fonsecaea erecta]|uniref:Uncharacterized protein n=1 Tax=Fonsecaea erecta TaxID=1367422 RepID=A0A178ZVZ3_9EURO|nr:hypothetical protein AYL99_03109 [Fonsecaea erecta]OAP63882.1 hypothetical protein AYL99_03109 [Fonsecaea erecta]
METVDNELLVHINAPSTAQDDRRYVSIAQHVLDFRSAVITRVSGASPPSLLSPPQGDDDHGAFIDTRRSFSPQPELPRPSTAPELTSSGDPPRLARTRTGRRRAFSETSSISNSFPARGTQGVENISATVSQLPPGAAPAEPLLASTNSERRRKKPRTEIGYSEAECVDRSAAIASDGDETDSTESVTSSQLRAYGLSGVATHRPEPAETRCVIDLTSPVDASPDARQVEVNSYRSPASPIASRAEPAPPLQQVDHQIRLLPVEIRPPYPLGGRSKFTTHITKTLKKLAHGEASLLKHFRPAFVCRDVRVLERGYWQFWIQIAEESVVRESRQHKRATLKLLGSTARKKRNDSVIVLDLQSPNHALWTEDEFLQFWKNMTLVIESGKVGWATRMTKELEDASLWK